mgnify:CR=1 FL=1
MYPAILFVDDDESLLDFLKALTSGWAYDIFLANSGEEAVQLIEEHPIKAVVADQEMPVMRGTELLDKVKKNYPNIVRCIMTGYSDQQSAIDAINKGEVFRFLRKPFTIEQLQGVLEDATEEFEKNRGREELFQKMEKLSKETNRKDRELQIQNSVGVLQVEDPGARVLQLNEAASKIFQLSSAELPFNLKDFFAAEDANELWGDLKHQAQIEGIARKQKRFSSVSFPGIYELILVPITESASGDRILFKLIVQSRHQVDSSEMSLYKYVLDLENASALKDRGLKFLYDMSKKIGMTHDLEELVQTIFADLKQIISFDLGMLATIHDGQTRLYAHSSFALSDAIKNNLKREIKEQYLSLTSTKLYEGHLNFNLKDWKGNSLENHEPQTYTGVRGTITLPLENPNDEVIGIIYIGSFSKSTYTGEELRLFATFSNRIALVLHIINNIFEYKEMQKIANRDSLTGLLNRRSFQDTLTDEIARSRRFGKSLSLLMIDIDNFKEINDTLGHLNGDEVLRKIAEIISNTMRSIDKAFRYGGEEFIILLPETDDKGAVVIAERLRMKIENYSFPIQGEISKDIPHINLTISIGVTWTSHPEDTHMQQLIEQCDKALYYAKQHGKNKVIKFDDIALQVT